MPFEKIRKILGKERILNWEHDRHPGILWRFPDKSSQNEMEKDPNKIDAFQVKLGERAVALINNEFYEDTPPGTYWLKGDQKKGLEIIFIDQGQLKEPWGIPGNIITKDDQYVGAHGFYVIRITDPKSFVLNIVSAQKTYTSEQVNDFINDHVSNILRQYLTNYSVLDGQILREQETFALAVKVKCHEMFSRWGLELVNLEVEIYIPDELKEVIKEKSITERQKLVTDEMEKREKFEERKMEIDKSLELLRTEINRTTGLKRLEVEKELESAHSQLDVLKKESQRVLQTIDVDIEKLKAEIVKIAIDIKAGGTERIGQAEALVTELKKRADLAGDILAKTTEAELKIKEQDAKFKGETEIERVHAWKDVEVAKAEAQTAIAEKERQAKVLQELAEVMARMAEATAMGEVEGEAIRKSLEEKFARLLAEAGINVPKYEEVKAMAKTPPKPYIKIEKEVIEKGEEKTRKCPSCGRNLAQDAKYCDNCGTKL